MADAHALAEQFDDLPQQQEAATLGMWTFLATEILFFGGLFLSYIVYRSNFPHEFAEASRRTIVLFGTVNTAILLTSSLTMALAVHAAQRGDSKWLVRFLLITVFLGLCFLGVKGLEYHEDVKEHLVPGRSFTPELSRPAQIFWYLYWAMTGLHSIHVLAGIGLLSWLTVLAQRGRFTPAYYTPVVLCGLYWHFVDLVWLFLYPLLYLIDRHA